MINKVFGLGFSKTGTTSLERALEILGYKVCKGHWNNNYTNYLLSLYVNKDFDELIRMTDYWEAFADGPWGGTQLYKKLVKWYPQAKFIHTVRDPEKWYISFEKMITQFDSNLSTAFNTYHKKRWGSAYYFQNVFNINTLEGSKNTIIKNYNDYNEEVSAFFRDSPFYYLKLNISDGGGWNSLCPFLGDKEPKVLFPHLNKVKRGGKINPYPVFSNSSVIRMIKKIKLKLRSRY